MAPGSYARKKTLRPAPTADKVKATIPLRTGRLHAQEAVTVEAEVVKEDREANAIHIHFTAPLKRRALDQRKQIPLRAGRYRDVELQSPLQRHSEWVKRLSICLVMAILFIGVVLLSGILHRQGPAQLALPGGMVYNIQVGGDQAGTWQSDQPMPPKVPMAQSGPYSVLGQPSITVDFINRVLASYHSPAAGKGQALYDLGVQYGIDPAYALAFFMHESTFGTQGEARTTMSLGNLRCIPDHPCVDKDRGGYAQMASWEDGFKTWYQLIRNFYVAQLGLDTVDKIIPTYAPSADHNDEQGYIRTLKHEIDTWHAGILQP